MQLDSSYSTRGTEFQLALIILPISLIFMNLIYQSQYESMANKPQKEHKTKDE